MTSHRIRELDEALHFAQPTPGHRHEELLAGLLIYAYSAYGPAEGLRLLESWSARGTSSQAKARERLAELRSAWDLLKRRIAEGKLRPMNLRKPP